MKLTKREALARERLCLALDVPTPGEALSLAEELAPYVAYNKIGKQLHTAAGREGIDIVGEIYRMGTSSFLDLKLHDTPNTVYEAAKAAGKLPGPPQAITQIGKAQGRSANRPVQPGRHGH